MPNINIRCDDELKSSVKKLGKLDSRDEAGMARHILTQYCMEHDPVFRALVLRGDYATAEIALARLEEITKAKSELTSEEFALKEIISGKAGTGKTITSYRADAKKEKTPRMSRNKKN